MAEETLNEDPKDASSDTETQGDNLPANTVDVEDAGTLKKKLTVAVSRERIDAKMDEMFGELATSAQVPGFRLGRAPRKLLEKRFGKDVGQDVRNALVGDAIGDAIEKSELKTMGEPQIELDKIELPDSGEMTFSFEVEVAPEFELPELKGIKVEKRSVEVDEARIREQLEHLQKLHATYSNTDEGAADGDVLDADARITGEGIDLDSRDLTLRVAPGQVEGLPLVDLPKALTGKKAGESGEISVTVPDAHPNEDWRGKDVKIELKIKQVRHRQLPEIDDAFATSLGFDSLEELRRQMADRLEARVKNEARRTMRDQVCKYLLDNTKFDLPEGVVDRHVAELLRRRYVELLQRGVPRETIDENLTKLQAAVSEQATDDLRLTFILGRVGEVENIEVTEEQVNSRVAQMAREYERRPERLRQELASDGTLQQLESLLREEKVLDMLLEQAQVQEVSAEVSAEKADEKTKKTKPKTAKKTSRKKSSSKSNKSKD